MHLTAKPLWKSIALICREIAICRKSAANLAFEVRRRIVETWKNGDRIKYVLIESYGGYDCALPGANSS
jgi:hypothetical protein